MSIKTKLVSLIMTFVMLASLVVVGVLALKQTDFQVSGNIVFKTKGIEATISSATLSEGVTVDKSMQEIVIGEETKEEDLTASYNTWKDMEVTLTGEEATLKFSITNDKEETTMYPFMRVEVGVTSASMTNADIQVTNNMGGNAIYLAPGATADYTITMYVNNLELDATVESFVIIFGLERMTTTPTESTVQLSYDSTGNYYYVEMGTYSESAVRWRLASFDGVNRYVPSSSTPPTMYTAVSGDTVAYKNVTFVQETVAMKYNFNADYEAADANDYAGSDIRTYLRNTSTTATGSSFIADLSIATTDTIYNKIQVKYGGKTAGQTNSLYDDINWNHNTYEVTDGTPQTTDSNSDKFWLMSVKEAYTLIGGGRIKDCKANWIYTDPVCQNLIWRQNLTGENGQWYWFRSPNPDYSSNAYNVNGDGDFNSYDVSNVFVVRAAFALDF